MLRPDPSHAKIRKADRCRRQRGNRQPFPTKYLGELWSQMILLIRFDVNESSSEQPRQFVSRLDNE